MKSKSEVCKSILSFFKKYNYKIYTPIILLLILIGAIDKRVVLTSIHRGVHEDIFQHFFPYIMILILFVQIILLIILNRKFNLLKLITAITVSNFVGMYFVFLMFAVKFNSYYLFVEFDFYYFTKLVLGDILRPGALWFHPGLYQGSEHFYYDSLPYVIIFILIATAVTSTLMWFWLRKDTEKRKLLFTVICISSFVLYSAISAFMWFAY